MIKFFMRAINWCADAGESKGPNGEQGAYPAGHYHSPVPSREDVLCGLSSKRAAPPMPDIDFRREEQGRLLEELARYYSELPFSAEKSDACRYYYDQDWFSYTDAILLYAMIRQFNIRRVIEIGSGFSSAVMVDTLERFGSRDFTITFIEPHAERLRGLVNVDADPRIQLIEMPLEQVDCVVFDGLEAGDLLFIDSSHVLKYRSDLQIALFEVLPRLNRGVFVHFHDVFRNFEYPDDWLKEGRYWNECYMLRAFLSGNRGWEMVLFADYVNCEFASFIEAKMPLCRKNCGGSLYLRKH